VVTAAHRWQRRANDVPDASTAIRYLRPAWRYAVVCISNLDGAKLKMEEDERLGRIASLSWMDDVGLTGQPGLRLINEIGIRVVRRASSLSPKR
jgi:hypothetical protein